MDTPRALMLAVLALGPAFASAATRGPDLGGYTATDATVFSFVDIAGPGGGASILAGTDDGTAALTLPFPFTFYGQARTLACVSTNGAMYFINDLAECAGVNDFANTDLSSTAPPGDRPTLLPFWTDLTFDAPGADAVSYQTLGLPGARRFVVQWNKAYPQGSANPVTFQIVLTEGTDKVVFQYKTVALGPGNPASQGAQATIGIRDATGQTNGRQIQWSFNAPVLTDGSALMYIASTPPVVGTPTSASITTTGATLGGTVTSDGGSAVTGRGVVVSITSDNANPSIGGPGVTTISEGGTTMGAFTTGVTGLTPATGYSFKAYAMNGAGTGYTSVAAFTTSAVAPTVTSPTSSSITGTTATLGGNVTGDGGSTITERGVVYAQTAANSNPLIDGTGVTKVPVIGSTGLFAAGVTGLSPTTSHSFKAFATNAIGTSYTSVATFTTTCPTITLGSLPNGNVNAAFTGSALASGGTGPYTYAVTSGSLPNGLSLTPSGAGAGNVSGTPTITGTFPFDITATDTSGAGTCTGVHSYSVVIDPELGQDFFTLTPCRVLDTRNATGPLGGPALVALADRIFVVAGTCGIPADAKAISLNIAVTQPTVAGNIRLHPGGTAVPLVSAINYKAGQTRSNNAVIPLSHLGELAAYLDQVAGTAHLILDVNGYFK